MHIQWTGSLRGLLAALVALFLLGCEEAADTGKTAEAPAEVGVIVARPAPIGITSELPGRLEAYRQAECGRASPASSPVACTRKARTSAPAPCCSRSTLRP